MAVIIAVGTDSDNGFGPTIVYAIFAFFVAAIGAALVGGLATLLIGAPLALLLARLLRNVHRLALHVAAFFVLGGVSAVILLEVVATATGYGLQPAQFMDHSGNWPLCMLLVAIAGGSAALGRWSAWHRAGRSKNLVRFDAF